MSATGPNAGNFSNRIKRLFNIYPNPAQARSKGIFAIGFLIVYLCIVLASANVLTARPVEPEKKPLKTSVNDHITFNTIFSDSTTAGNPLDNKKITSQPVAGEKIRLMDIPRADTTVKEQSLAHCLQQVNLILKMASLYRLPGDSLKFSKFSAWDSLQMAGSMDYLTKKTFKFQPTRFYGTVNLSSITKSDLIDTAGNETTKDTVLEKIHRAAVDSITIHNNQQAINPYGNDGKNGVIDVRLKPGTSIEELTKGVAVQVFPNSTNGSLNISFTPARNNSRVKMILVDLDGKVVKEITDSTYDSIPMELHVDVSSYKKGIYILQINIDRAKSQQRVVVE